MRQQGLTLNPPKSISWMLLRTLKSFIALNKPLEVCRELEHLVLLLAAPILHDFGKDWHPLLPAQHAVLVPRPVTVLCRSGAVAARWEGEGEEGQAMGRVPKGRASQPKLNVGYRS